MVARPVRFVCFALSRRMFVEKKWQDHFLFDYILHIPICIVYTHLCMYDERCVDLLFLSSYSNDYNDQSVINTWVERYRGSCLVPTSKICLICLLYSQSPANYTTAYRFCIYSGKYTRSVIVTRGIGVSLSSLSSSCQIWHPAAKFLGKNRCSCNFVVSRTKIQISYALWKICTFGINEIRKTMG